MGVMRKLLLAGVAGASMAVVATALAQQPNPVADSSFVLPDGERVLELEALPPSAMVADAARRMLAMVPGDPLMAPLDKDREKGMTP